MRKLLIAVVTGVCFILTGVGGDASASPAPPQGPGFPKKEPKKKEVKKKDPKDKAGPE